jgi:tetratricopeptide (TPR) repeat protein
MGAAASIAACDDTTTPVPDLLGVKLSFFQYLIASKGGEDAFRGMTTAEVCEKFVVDHCKETDKSICEELLQLHSHFAGIPSVFVSHTWRYMFLDTVEAMTLALERIYGKENAQDVVVWFDLFSLIQKGERNEIPYEVLSNTFINKIKEIGSVVMVMLPYDDPETLKRAWCVYELYACQLTNGVFHVAMTAAENQRFLDGIKKDSRTFYSMLTKIKSESSQATVPDDLIKIRQAIQELCGFTQLDRIIFELMVKWMISLLESKIKEQTDEIEKSAYMKALGGVYEKSGQLDEAEPLFKEALDTRRRVLGDTHPDTLSSINNMASLYKAKGKYDLAEPLFKDALDVRRRVLGDTHPDTLISIYDTANLYKAKGEYDLAEPLYK